MRRSGDGPCSLEIPRRAQAFAAGPRGCGVYKNRLLRAQAPFRNLRSGMWDKLWKSACRPTRMRASFSPDRQSAAHPPYSRHEPVHRAVRPQPRDQHAAHMAARCGQPAAARRHRLGLRRADGHRLCRRLRRRLAVGWCAASARRWCSPCTRRGRSAPPSSRPASPSSRSCRAAPACPPRRSSTSSRRSCSTPSRSAAAMPRRSPSPMRSCENCRRANSPACSRTRSAISRMRTCG